MSEPPTCVAVLLCDQIIDDVRSRNKSYIGSFNTIQCNVLPSNHPKVCILVSLTNLIGPHDLTVSITTPSDTKIFDATTPVESPNPLQVADFIFEIFGMPVTETGTYFVDAKVDGSHVGGRRFEVMLI